MCYFMYAVHMAAPKYLLPGACGFGSPNGIALLVSRNGYE